MKIIIKTKNIKLTDELKGFVEKKFLGLRKFINILKRDDEIGKTLAEIFIDLEKETEHHRRGNVFQVKSRVYLPRREIVSQAKTDNLLTAVVEAKEKLKKEIEKYKSKIIDKNRR